MKNILCFVFMFSCTLLFAQHPDLSGVEINNVKIATTKSHLEIDFDYRFPNPNSESDWSAEIAAEIKTKDYNIVGTKRNVLFYTYNSQSKRKILFLPIRNINLNQGQYEVTVDLVVYLFEKNEKEYHRIVSSHDYVLQQPKRYEITVQLSGGTVSPIGPENRRIDTWDSPTTFNKDDPLPDLQWWIYVGSNYSTTPSDKNVNSLLAPPASFTIIALHSEHIKVRLYDEDKFASDDLVGTYPILHPNESMQESYSNLTSKKVSGFHLQFEKQLFVLPE